MTDAATSVAAAAYQAFQSATPETIPTLTSEFTTLVSAAANHDVQPHVRVYALNTIGQHGSQFDKASVKAAMEGIITLLGDENETNAPHKLIVAAIEAFVNMCKGTAAKQDDLVRVAADLCVIILLNKEGFPQAALDAAEAGLKELTKASVVGVVKKYLHLLSDEREKDEDEQLEKERAFAISRLAKTVNDRQYIDQWTEEAQTAVQGFLASVIPTVQRDELKVLCQTFTKLSSLGDGTFIVDKLLKAKLDNTRLVEALTVVAPFIPRTVTHPAIAEKLLTLVSGKAEAPAPALKKGGKKAAAAAAAATAAADADKLDLTTDLNAGVAFVLAARTASAEIADKVADVFLDALDKVIPALAEESDNTDATTAPEGLPENVTATEAILLGLATIAVKNPQYVLEKVSNDALVARLNQTYKALSYFKKVTIFAAKKKQVDENPTPEEKNEAALAITALTNLTTLVAPLTTKHLPTATLTPSWEKALPPPRVAGKKSARDSILSSLIPDANKTAKDDKTKENLLNTPLPTKKGRTEGGNNGRSNSNNNRNGGNNKQQQKNVKRGGRRF